MNNQIETFANAVRTQYGQNFDPSSMAQKMLGQQVSSPRQALDLMLRMGRISQQQYNMYIKML